MLLSLFLDKAYEAMWLIALLALSAVLWLAFISITFYNSRNLPKVQSGEKRFSSKVSIIIPSRNEERRIGKCIKSLKEQSYPNFEVIVVDDSTDRTVEVVKSEAKGDDRFKIVKQEKLPEGWLGKSFALQQGSKLAEGEYLIFIDADTYFEKNAIEEAINYAVEKNVDMLSLAPQHVCKSFWENIIQPIPLCSLAILSPPARINDPKSKTALAAGPFILVKRETFERIGGYAAIRDRIADDAELAKLLKSKGFKLIFANGQHLVKLRMYEGLKDAWEGWSKVSFMGLVQKREIKSKVLQILILLAALFIMSIAFLAPIFILLFSLFSHLWLLSILSAVVYLINVISIAYAQKVYSIGSPKYSLIVPIVGGALMMAIVTNSAVRTLSGKGVRWKGRVYFAK